MVHCRLLSGCFNACFKSLEFLILLSLLLCLLLQCLVVILQGLQSLHDHVHVGGSSCCRGRHSWSCMLLLLCKPSSKLCKRVLVAKCKWGVCVSPVLFFIVFVLVFFIVFRAETSLCPRGTFFLSFSHRFQRVFNNMSKVWFSLP